MSLQEKDQSTHHPLLSSLVVRGTDSSGGGGGGGGGGTGSDFEPGEVRRDPLRYSRSDRYDGQGYRMRAGSASPVRRHHRFSPSFEPSHGHGHGRGRDYGRNRDYSPPPYGRGKDDGRFGAGRGGYDRSARGRGGSLRNDGLPRNNPNVRPREGDWICSDPSCKNLNFARRDHCNSCNKPRYSPSSGTISPRRGPPFPPRQRAPPPNPLDRPIINGGGYRSPPRGWLRDAPRDFRAPPAPRQDYPEDDRYRYDNNNSRPMVPDWAHRDRGRGDSNYFNNERRAYGRRMLSPPPPPGPPPPRGWAPPIIRDRSRSPVRGGPPPKEYQRDIYMDRRRNDRRGGGRRDAF